MKILRVETRNIGGLADTDLVFPTSSVVAFAGSNGSGKSKLLSCIGAPWSRQLPAPGDEKEESFVEVTIQFDDDELAAQKEFTQQRSLVFEHDEASEISIRVKRTTLAGIQMSVNPPSHWWVPDMLADENVQRMIPSLDFIHIPAERRLVSYPGNGFTLMSIDPMENLRMISSRGPGVGVPGQQEVLDDHEFENYARTLCIAAYLPDAEGNHNESHLSSWKRFKAAVDSVLEPKSLLPLTQEDPSNLRILLSSGQSHAIRDLSSGERQALIIISRVFRAGEGHSQIAIDEPDAYLHPALCTKLLYALQLGVQDGGKLILATHSPAILDSIDPSAIYRLGHGTPPTPVLSQDRLLDLYRSAGFRVSAVTQSDILVMTEGDFDAEVLQDLIPELKSASVRSAGGRDLVLRNLAALRSVDLPIVGVVDGDVLAATPDVSIANNCHVWSAADIEGVLLSDDAFLSAALEARAFNSDITTLREISDHLNDAVESLRQVTINEFALRTIRLAATPEWPGPKDQQIKAKLVRILEPSQASRTVIIDEAFAAAEKAWDDCGDQKWKLVRGKYVLKRALSTISPIKSGGDFIRIALGRAPELQEIGKLRSLILTTAPSLARASSQIVGV